MIPENNSRVDNAFLVSLVGTRPEKYFWLGLSNQDDAEKFVWTNTETVRFTHWNAGMPGKEKYRSPSLTSRQTVASQLKIHNFSIDN